MTNVCYTSATVIWGGVLDAEINQRQGIVLKMEIKKLLKKCPGSLTTPKKIKKFRLSPDLVHFLIASRGVDMPTSFKRETEIQ